MGEREANGNLFGGGFEGGGWKCDCAAVFVFDDDGKVVVAKDGGGQIEYLGQFAGGQAVLDIVGDEELELTVGGAAGGAAAVDEVFLHAADFGHMEVRGHDVVVGEDDVEVGVGVVAEGGDKRMSGDHGVETVV